MDLKEIALNKSNKRHPWELARIKVITHFIKQSLDLSKETITVLDIGSGDTFLINELSKTFPNILFYAVDTEYNEAYLTRTNQEYQQRNISIQVFNNLLSAEREVKTTVDLVLLLDVIEHVPDDVQLLKELANLKKVTSQTLFLITVPAFQTLFCSHDVFLGHFRRYNNSLLKRNVFKANLVVKDAGYFFLLPLFLRLLQTCKEKLIASRKKPTGIGNWEGNALTTKALIWMLWMDFSLARLFRLAHIKLPGLSNFAICKKYA